MTNKQVLLNDLIGEDLEEDFKNFDLTEIQEVLSCLASENTVDIAHCEMLMQKSLRGADILSEYLGKMIKTVNYLEVRLNSVKNKAALNFKSDDGSKPSIQLRVMASEADLEVSELAMKLGRAQAGQAVLSKKFDLIVKSHYHYKEVLVGLRKTILGYGGAPNNQTDVNALDGWR